MKSLSLSPSLREMFMWLRASAAETLAEVIIALVVISVGAGGAMTLIIMSIRANGDAEERIIAYNLAREGVEAVRTIRDTNWLRFPGDKADCWDVFPNVIDPTLCSGTGDRFEDDIYIVYLDLADSDSYMTWQIQSVSDAETLEIETIGTDGIVYTHADGCDSGCDGGTSIYSRKVEISDKDSDSMKVSATVVWESRGQSKQVTFVDKLTNY